MLTAVVTISLVPGFKYGFASPLSSAGSTVHPDPLTLTAVPVQDKILQGSDGRISVLLTLSAPEIEDAVDRPAPPMDLVLVLDRSGSMNGQKIDHAKRASTLLLDRLTPDDRLALVTYANDVRVASPLVSMGYGNRNRLKQTVRRVRVGGGTNLGGGLWQGIDLFTWDQSTHRRRKLILISDGLANHGITDPFALGEMASTAPSRGFTISTVGVGLNFNEMLMTTIADHGAGQYHYLEDPADFAMVFEKEFQKTLNLAAANIEIIIPLTRGVRLLDAGGYPVTERNSSAVIQPGNLVSGGERSFFLTFTVPADKTDDIQIGNIQMKYRHNAKMHTRQMKKPLEISCVNDPAAVEKSIRKEAWSRHVVQEKFGTLKNEVADAIRKGDRRLARQKIKAYKTRNQAINAKVGSKAVQKNLDKEVKVLREQVENTFKGAPAQVSKKKKQNAKALQYDSYKIRRDKQ